jgi:hypothetical protein
MAVALEPALRWMHTMRRTCVLFAARVGGALLLELQVGCRSGDAQAQCDVAVSRVYAAALLLSCC